MNKQINTGDAGSGTRDSGFTLVEILIAIVLIGVLSAVAVVGVSSLTKQGSDSACEASRDAAKAASVVYFAANKNTYPVNFDELTTPPESGGDAALELPEDAVVEDVAATVGTWTLTMTPGKTPTAKPTFACS